MSWWQIIGLMALGGVIAIGLLYLHVILVIRRGF
jgi:hypothetical protein